MTLPFFSVFCPVPRLGAGRSCFYGFFTRPDGLAPCKIRAHAVHYMYLTIYDHEQEFFSWNLLKPPVP